MKKAALVIAILSVSTAILMDNQISVVPGYGSFAADMKSCVAESVQKRDEVTEQFHQTYPINPSGRVSIANINGDVHISAWDQPSVKVDAVKRAYSQQRLSELTIDVTNSADTVEIKTRYPNDREGRHDGWASVEYTLTIPRGARLEGVELVNGSLDIEGVQGDVHASLVNGDVKARGLGGEVKISTVNGAVEANVARLDDAKGVNLNSVNGSLVLIIPAGAGAQVKASTLHGAITNDFGLKVDDGQFVGHNLNGQIGSGGPRIKLSNVNGSIAIKSGMAM